MNSLLPRTHSSYAHRSRPRRNASTLSQPPMLRTSPRLLADLLGAPAPRRTRQIPGTEHGLSRLLAQTGPRRNRHPAIPDSQPQPGHCDPSMDTDLRPPKAPERLRVGQLRSTPLISLRSAISFGSHGRATLGCNSNNGRFGPTSPMSRNFRHSNTPIASRSVTSVRMAASAGTRTGSMSPPSAPGSTWAWKKSTRASGTSTSWGQGTVCLDRSRRRSRPARARCCCGCSPSFSLGAVPPSLDRL